MSRVVIFFDGFNGLRRERSFCVYNDSHLRAWHHVIQSQSSITVNVGDTVHWDNSTASAGLHNVAPNGGTEPVANAAGDPWTYDYTFNNPGAFPYYLSVSMVLRR